MKFKNDERTKGRRRRSLKALYLGLSWDLVLRFATALITSSCNVVGELSERMSVVVESSRSLFETAVNLKIQIIQKFKNR